MLAPLGRPSPARKKYEQVLLLPRKQLQHIDLSPPKAKSTQLTESSNGQGPTSKRKTLSDEENNAIWRRWKAAKDAEMRRRRQANAPLSDQELTPLVEQTAEESRKAVAAEGASFVTYVWMAMVDAQFLKWKKTKDDERRRERQRKRDLEAAWAVNIEPTFEAQHFPTVQHATASGKARSKPNETKLPPLLSALSMVERPECSDRDSKREFQDDVEKLPNVQSKNVSADRVVRDGADYFDQVDAIAGEWPIAHDGK
ncbi:hypothetical protein DYB32_000497 [Aphanomyces invadans]|uniref:Uncharacterized protein n=1 Tax=Aphanomyces invadans TaxID=157072 RepID=A0A418B9Z6_9STRA|nr:hypothetical protein DYB32_000497 [Aphanomyces invadans]